MHTAITAEVDPHHIHVDPLPSSHLYTKANGGIACSNVIIAAIRTAIPRENIIFFKLLVFIVLPKSIIRN